MSVSCLMWEHTVCKSCDLWWFSAFLTHVFYPQLKRQRQCFFVELYFWNYFIKSSLLINLYHYRIILLLTNILANSSPPPHHVSVEDKTCLPERDLTSADMNNASWTGWGDEEQRSACVYGGACWGQFTQQFISSQVTTQTILQVTMRTDRSVRESGLVTHRLSITQG